MATEVIMPKVDMVTFLLKPFDEGTRFHDHIHFGHNDFGCHVYFPSCARARAAETISSTWGTAARSRLRL